MRYGMLAWSLNWGKKYCEGLSQLNKSESVILLSSIMYTEKKGPLKQRELADTTSVMWSNSPQWYWDKRTVCVFRWRGKCTAAPLHILGTMSYQISSLGNGQRQNVKKLEETSVD